MKNKKTNWYNLPSRVSNLENSDGSSKAGTTKSLPLSSQGFYFANDKVEYLREAIQNYIDSGVVISSGDNIIMDLTYDSFMLEGTFSRYEEDFSVYQGQIHLVGSYVHNNTIKKFKIVFKETGSFVKDVWPSV